MQTDRTIVYALAGVSIGLFGLSLSLLGLAFEIEGGPSIGPFPVLGVAVVSLGMIVSIVAALMRSSQKS